MLTLSFEPLVGPKVVLFLPIGFFSLSGCIRLAGLTVLLSILFAA